MFRKFAGLLIGCFLFAAEGPTYAQEAPYKFKVEDIPLEFSFQGQNRQDIVRFTDINNNGEWIGNDFAGDGFLMEVKHHKDSLLSRNLNGFGFFVSKTQGVTEIRCPGDRTDNDSTVVTAINNLGQVVGFCTDAVSPTRTVGFIRDRNGHFTILAFPGADGTLAFGINDLGQVVGQYFGFGFGAGLNRFHGFVWKNGVYTTLDAPDSEHLATSLLGINNAGQIIGAYLHHRPGSDANDYDSELSFLYDNGNFRPLAFPGAKAPFVCCGATTFPMDINNLGQVIGSTYAPNGQPQFFFYQRTQYFVITGLPENVVDANDLSIVHGSSAWGMNDDAEIAGTYVQKVPCNTCSPQNGPGFRFVPHGFFATPKRGNTKKSPVTALRNDIYSALDAAAAVNPE
jgi:uncharacterized membrane protein